MTRFLQIIALTAFFGGLSFAQYMNDSSSTYADTWGDPTYGLEGYGSVSHGLSIHEYAMDVTITSPKGRQASATGSYGSPGASASNDVYLPWNFSDLGIYDVSIKPRGWCTIAKVAFTLAIVITTPKVGAPVVTYYQDPQMVAGQCHWVSTACLPGTFPTCPNGVNYYPYATCPNYVSVSFVPLTEAVIKVCLQFTVKPKGETGLGACT